MHVFADFYEMYSVNVIVQKMDRLYYQFLPSEEEYKVFFFPKQVINFFFLKNF